MSEKLMEKNNHYLTFVLNRENYAIPVTDILEVLLVPKVTPIPNMPDFMRGVINIRGSVVPILDLRRKFGMGETEVGDSTAIIVLDLPSEKSAEGAAMLHLGIYADSVTKVIILDASKIEPPPRIGSMIQTSFIKGLGHIDDSFIVILDIKKVLSDEDVELMETVHDALPERVVNGSKI